MGLKKQIPISFRHGSTMFVVLEETEEENREQLVVAYSPHSWIHLIFYERWQKCDIQSQRLKFSNKRYRTESLLVNGNNIITT